MSATVYSPSETLIEDYPKPNKHHTKSISLLNTGSIQAAYTQQLPSIGSVMPGNQSPQVKAEDTASAVSYFNNPFPVYYSAQNRRETEMTSQFLGLCSTTYNATSQTSNINYVPATMSPQNSYSASHNLFPPPPPQSVVKKSNRVSKNSDKCTCKRLENHIPRPRNAFILFRQKHHQSVLKESTDLKTNPEVSRELARRWKALTQEERSKWNSLAEQEKRDHAQKYPNYRYKPRRHKKCSECSSCSVKRPQAEQVAPSSYAAYSDYAQLMLGSDVKAQKSPLMSHVPQQFVQIPPQSQGHQQHHHQHHQHHQSHQGHHGNSQHYLSAQQHQQQVQSTDLMYSMQRYVPHGNFHSQYPFADGVAQPSSSSLQGQQALQHTVQQQYHIQQRGHSQSHHSQMQPQLPHHHQGQHHSQLAIEGPGHGHVQSHGPSSSQDAGQDGVGVSQGQSQLHSQSSQSSHEHSQGQEHSSQNTSATSSQNVMNPHMQAYSDKYPETTAFQYPGQAVAGQKYGSLPTTVSNNMYSSHDSFTAPTSLQSY